MTIEKAKIISSLYSMDTIQYIANAQENLQAEPEHSAHEAICEGIWEGDKLNKNIVSYLNPHLSTLPSILDKLSATSTIKETIKEIEERYLNDASSDADLKEVIELISSSSLSAEDKAKIKSALYLMDTIQYITNAQENLQAEPGYSTHEDIYESVWEGAQLNKNIRDRIGPSRTTLNTIFSLGIANDAEPKKFMEALEDEHLTDPGSNSDLIAALCIMDPNQAYCGPTTWNGLAKLIEERDLPVEAKVQVSASSITFPGQSGKDNIPKNLRPAAENENISTGLEVTLGSVRDPIPLAEWKNFVLLCNLGAKYQQFTYKTDASDDTIRSSLEIGLRPRFILDPKSRTSLDPYGNYKFEGADSQHANRLFYNGLGHHGTAGLALRTGFGSKSFTAELFAEGRFGRISYDKGTFGFPFSIGKIRALRIGGRLDLDFNKQDNKYMRLTLLAAGIPPNSGEVEVPEHALSAGIDTSSFERLSALELEAKILSVRKRPWGFFRSAGIRYSQFNQEGRDPSRDLDINFEFDGEGAGTWKLGGEWGKNRTRYNGGDYLGTSLTWELPWLGRSLSLTPSVGTLDMEHPVWGVNVNLHVFKAFGLGQALENEKSAKPEAQEFFLPEEVEAPKQLPDSGDIFEPIEED